MRPGLAACGAGGLPVQELAGRLVVGPGVPEAELAGEAGLARAICARLGTVAFPLGGDVQRGQNGPDLAVGERDSVKVVPGNGRFRFGFRIGRAQATPAGIAPG